METIHLFILFYITVILVVLGFWQHRCDLKKLTTLQHAATFAYQRAQITSENPKYRFSGASAKIIERKETGGFRNVPLEVHIISQNAEKEVFLFIWDSDNPTSAYVKHLFTPS
jgi:hypothetical protein